MGKDDFCSFLNIYRRILHQINLENFSFLCELRVKAQKFLLREIEQKASSLLLTFGQFGSISNLNLLAFNVSSKFEVNLFIFTIGRVSTIDIHTFTQTYRWTAMVRSLHWSRIYIFHRVSEAFFFLKRCKHFNKVNIPPSFGGAYEKILPSNSKKKIEWEVTQM